MSYQKSLSAFHELMEQVIMDEYDAGQLIEDIETEIDSLEPDAEDTRWRDEKGIAEYISELCEIQRHARDFEV